MDEETKLSKLFSARLRLDVNNLSKYYFEEPIIEEEFPSLYLFKLKI